LGLGLGGGVKLCDIEVVNNENGKPELKLCKTAKTQIEKERLQRFI